MNHETNNQDFNLDFSMNSGKVINLEQFLEEEVVDSKDNSQDLVLSVDSSKDDDKVGIGNFLDGDKVDIKDEKINDDSTINLEPSDIDIESDKNLKYKEILSNLVESGIIDDIEAFDVEGEEIPFEDMDIDADTFIDILKIKQEELKEKLLENKVSTESISDFTKKLIEIEKNGGNVQEALLSYQKYKNPIDTLDLTSEEDQQSVIYLKLQASGLEDRDIIDIIKTYKSNGDLSDKAVQAKEDLEKAFNKQMEALNQEAIERKQRYEESLKTYRDNLSKNLSKFSLTDSYKKKVLDLATKQDNNGKFELDRIYAEIRQDPEKATDLVMFLTNRDEYIKQLTEEVKRDSNLNVMKKLKLVPKGKSSVNLSSNRNNVKDNNFIDLDKL